MQTTATDGSGASRADFNVKLEMVRQIALELGIQGVLVQTQASFAWLTGGRSHISLSSTMGASSLWTDASGSRVVLCTSNIEGRRMVIEELVGLGVELQVQNWWESASPLQVVQIMTGMLQCVIEEFCEESELCLESNPNVTARLENARETLTEIDVQRYRELGKDCGEVIAESAREVQRGMTEFQVAGIMAGKCLARGIDLVVALVAADDRMQRYRHPLPTLKQIHQGAMLIMVGRRFGLHASCTRTVYFGSVPEVMRQRHQEVTYIDAVAIKQTIAGRAALDMFRIISEAYESMGWTDEWKNHHQGGATSYSTRNWKATPTGTQVVRANMAFAWNPTIQGTKSEDTILVSSDDGSLPEVLTYSRDWPMIIHTIEGVSIPRPDILEVEG